MNEKGRVVRCFNFGINEPISHNIISRLFMGDGAEGQGGCSPSPLPPNKNLGGGSAPHSTVPKVSLAEHKIDNHSRDLAQIVPMVNAFDFSSGCPEFSPRGLALLVSNQKYELMSTGEWDNVCNLLLPCYVL